MLILDNLHSEQWNPAESLWHLLSYLCEGQNFISWCSSDIRQECALPNTFLALSINPLLHRCEFIIPAFFRLSRKFTQIASSCCSTQETISVIQSPLMGSRLRYCLGMVHFQLARCLSYTSSVMLSLTLISRNLGQSEIRLRSVLINRYTMKYVLIPTVFHLT